jgi:hypothetical protein
MGAYPQVYGVILPHNYRQKSWSHYREEIDLIEKKTPDTNRDREGRRAVWDEVLSAAARLVFG